MSWTKILPFWHVNLQRLLWQVVEIVDEFAKQVIDDKWTGYFSRWQLDCGTNLLSLMPPRPHHPVSCCSHRIDSLLRCATEVILPLSLWSD